MEAFKRLKQHGPNALSAPEPVNVPKLFFQQFQSPLIYILLIASVIVFFLGDVTDSLVILGVLVINAIIGVVQEGKAHNTLRALRSFAKTEALVLRDGIETTVSDTEVVPGDIIILREGDKVPADARLIDARTLSVNESALTGESVPSSKSEDATPAAQTAIGDQKNMLFKGTFLVAGFAKAVVVATGLNTVIGAISKQIVTLDTEIPLKKDIRKLSRFVSVGVLAASALVFAVGLWHGNSINTMFFIAVAVAVSLIPEGLPIVITIVLASGAYRMAKQNALVKNLAAVEALGQATVIAVDKTGTITKNELMVEEVWVAEKLFMVSGSGYEPRGALSLVAHGERGGAVLVEAANHPELLLVGKVAAFCASARVTFSEKERVWHVAGDPTEAALRVFGEKIGFIKDDLEEEEPLLGEIPFDAKLKYHVTLHKVGRNRFMTIVGAPETVLALCKHQWFDGKSRAFTAQRREAAEAGVHALSRKGERVIAAAIIPAFKGELDESVAVSGATFLGLFGMRDTLREGVHDAVEAARARGLRVVMITGDHKMTAEAIARDAGIFRDGDVVLTEKELRDMSEADLKAVLPQVSVFARIAPEEKLTLIKLYRSRGEVVAMTGDGVNDALSLVAADLGVAMGNIGTEVSKEAADIVLLDDNFNSIVGAIDEGRNMYVGIKKVILYLFSTGFGELFTVLFALLLALPLPLFPTQILWLNLVTDGFLVFALGLEPKEPFDSGDKNATRPRKNNHGFFDRSAIVRMLLMAVVMSIGSIILFVGVYKTDFTKASTLTLTALAIFQWFNAWNVRSESKSIFKMGLFTNWYLVVSTVAVIGLQFFAIYTPFMQKLLHTSPLTFVELVLAVVFSLSIFVVEELRKIITPYIAAQLPHLKKQLWPHTTRIQTKS